MEGADRVEMTLEGVEQLRHVHPTRGMDTPDPRRTLDVRQTRAREVFAHSSPLAHPVIFVPSRVPRVSVLAVGEDLGHRNVVQKLPRKARRRLDGLHRRAHFRQVLSGVPNLDDPSERNGIEHSRRHPRCGRRTVSPPLHVAPPFGELPRNKGTGQTPAHDNDALFGGLDHVEVTETWSSGLRNHAEVARDFFESRQCPVEVLPRMGGAELHPDSGFALGHHRIEKADDVNAFLKQSIGHNLGELGIAKHDGHDGRFAVLERQACMAQAFLEVSRVFLKRVTQFRGLIQHFEHFDGGADNTRSERIREQVGTASLAQHVDDFALARRKPAHRTSHGLAKGAGDDVDATKRVPQFDGAAARLANESRGVAFVHHDHGFVGVAEIANFVDLGHVAVHREHPVGDDDDVSRAVCSRFLQALLELGHVVVRVAVARSFAQAHPVDDRRVVEAVADDGVLGAQERLEDSAVGVKCGGIQDGVFGVMEVRDTLLQLLVDVLGAADEAHT